VIAIIAILAAILMPALGQARRVAWRAACANHQRQLGVAVAVYAADAADLMPVGHQRWRSLLLPYLYPDPPVSNTKTLTVYDCPASVHRVYLNRTAGGGGIVQNDDGNSGSMGVVWLQMANDRDRACLWENGPCNASGVCRKSGDNWYWPLAGGRAWDKPSESVYVADSVRSLTALAHPTAEGTDGVDSKGTNHVAVYTAGWPAPIASAGYWAAVSPGGVRRFADRHGGTNCLFVDGHVQAWNTLALESMRPDAPDCIWDTR
jgi:prepilin-type processing-associated H-X9-DG protein